MPDIIDANGLQVKTLSELIGELEDALRDIYGADINIDPDTPDGQLINIVAQAGVDTREIIASLVASFDPDQASGRILDQRVALNGIQRRGGTFTFTPITITTDRALNLVGLNGDVLEPEPDVPNLYTVTDGAGTRFFLVSSTSIAEAGDHVLQFRAADVGRVEITLNTITEPETIIAGVTQVNNPEAPTVIGEDEETDGALKLRRRQSTAIGSTGGLDSLIAALLNIEGVITALVLENPTGETDADGVPPNSIWVIVEGGSDEDIGEAIYAKKSLGAGMRGEESHTVTRIDGRPATVFFDRALEQDLYLRFSLAGDYDEGEIAAAIVEGVIFRLGEPATADTITCFVKGINDALVITSVELSLDDVTYSQVVEADSVQNRLVLDVERIEING